MREDHILLITGVTLLLTVVITLSSLKSNVWTECRTNHSFRDCLELAGR